MLRVGDRVPAATLLDQDGMEVDLHGLLGQSVVVLYFYPKDETSGCTAQACSFRDDYESFVDAGAKVVGVSSDSVSSHRKFADHHRLPFTLLSDPGGKLRAAFGVKKTLGLIDGRVTFVIDRDGVIRHTFDSMLQASRHVGEAIRAVRAIGAKK